jgi:acylphosphatase
MTARALLKVKGRVQGVFYRQCTVDQARLLGLAGWVANESDGTVVIDAQGDRGQIESLIIWCWKGPPSARVVQVDVEWQGELETDSKSFVILR